MRFVRWRMRGGELRRFGRDVEDGGREWLPLDQPGQVDLLCCHMNQPGQVDLLCRHMNQPGQVDQLCRFAVEKGNRIRNPAPCFFTIKSVSPVWDLSSALVKMRPVPPISPKE